MTSTAPNLTADDLYLFNEGSHFRLYDILGAHRTPEGTHFAVWAPAAGRVAVVGDFNGWSPDATPMAPVGASGIWHAFAPGVGRGSIYKYRIDEREKADPYGFHHETPPKTASIVWDLEYAWGDDAWLASRASRASLAAPMSIYEVHLGSFMRVVEDGCRSLSFREVTHALLDHVTRHGYTHVELLPPTEHPFAGSWGYQVTGYFAPTSRFGTPQDFMYLVDTFHQHGVGVILDWVPAHFPTDPHGLGEFDGTHLYEHADPRQGFHPDWNTYIFNYGRHEVRAFLISSAAFWLDRYHIDGLRVDGVASMLYLDYSRAEGEWIPNIHGGRENLEAVSLLKRLNDHLHDRFPDAITVAEESTAWPGVSHPASEGGLGFDYKWDMGFMHDTLSYLQKDPLFRKHHHRQLTFRGLYAYDERYVLPLSHDEVVHGKGSLIRKMPGDDWQRFANLRVLYAHMWATPGKKLLFMGADVAQEREWDHDGSVDWHLLDLPYHRGVSALVGRLNELYRARPALHELDGSPAGFEWVVVDDAEHSTVAFLRCSSQGEVVLCAANFTPVPRHGVRLGVPFPGYWEEILNTDSDDYGGSDVGNLGGAHAEEEPACRQPCSIVVTLPPLAAVWFAPRP